MSLPHLKPWTHEQFFAWEGHGEDRYEFDGKQPVVMNRVTITHAMISRNLHRLLGERLRRSGYHALGPDIGVCTIANAVRFPDALVTSKKLHGGAYTVPDVVVVFEILSPGSGRRDRIAKLREYAGVPSIRRYVIVESASIGLTVMQRQAGDHPWTTTTLMDAAEVLCMPEISIEVPVGALYEDVVFDESES